mmetsp:Transcript_89214/g.181981  ORF Transcript_89214/g.181981 Transcript_89214/m.181981 type:complete len:102 (+) Transcript_89214:153-458(+)
MLFDILQSYREKSIRIIDLAHLIFPHLRQCLPQMEHLWRPSTRAHWASAEKEEKPYRVAISATMFCYVLTPVASTVIAFSNFGCCRELTFSDISDPSSALS